MLKATQDVIMYMGLLLFGGIFIALASKGLLGMFNAYMGAPLLIKVVIGVPVALSLTATISEAVLEYQANKRNRQWYAENNF